MYNNIGRKIKGLVKTLFIIEAIAAVITGIVLLSIDDDFILAGLLVMIVLPFVAWISSWLLYAFGELVDKICDIERNTRGCETKSESPEALNSERISNLEKLRSQGLITEEEYQQAISKNQHEV